MFKVFWAIITFPLIDSEHSLGMHERQFANQRDDQREKINEKSVRVIMRIMHAQEKSTLTTRKNDGRKHGKVQVMLLTRQLERE